MKKTCLFLMVCCYLQKATAQPQHLDADQQAAIDKVTYAIKIVFNKLNSPDWVLRQDYYTPNMTLLYQQPGAPLGVNNNYERVYDLKEGSPTYQKLVQPLLDHKKVLAQALQYDSLRVMDSKIAALSHFEVYANINMAAVDMHQQRKNGSYQPLSVKGCAYSCRTNADNLNGTTRPSFYLLIGNWDITQCQSTGHVVQFKFTHPEKTPFIENIDIKIIGDNDVIQNMINKTDWNILKNALTI